MNMPVVGSFLNFKGFMKSKKYVSQFKMSVQKDLILYSLFLVVINVLGVELRVNYKNKKVYFIKHIQKYISI